MKVEGQVAVVTGAAGGIGFALAHRLLEHGARVVVADLDGDRLAEAVDELGADASDRVVGCAGDVSLKEDLQAIIDQAALWTGGVDLFVANAGIAVGRGLEADESDWGSSLEVNVMAHVRAAQLLIPGWLERGHGYFVSTASAAGLLTQVGSPTYAVSKHAAVAFAEWLSVTYGDQGIRVSVLCPMGVRTNMLSRGAESDDDVERRAARAVEASGSVLDPVDVADAVMRGLDEETFLILPHPEVMTFFQQKATDYDRWLAGMRRHQASLG